MSTGVHIAGHTLNDQDARLRAISSTWSLAWRRVIALVGRQRRLLILIAILVVATLTGAALAGFISLAAVAESLRAGTLALLLEAGLFITLAVILLADSRFRRPAWIVFASLGAATALFILVFHLQNPLADAQAYYDAGTRLNAGLPLYPANADNNAADFYRYPPLLAIIFRPLALLPYQMASFLWEAFCLLIFGLTVRRLDLRRFEVRIALGILAVFILRALIIGQAEVLVAWLLLIGSPASVALAANLKLFPLLVGLYWLGRRDWHSLRQLVAAMVSLALIQLVLEPNNSLAFLRTISLSQADATIGNFSPYLLSPILWAGLAIAGAFMVLALARTKAGWPAAITFAVLVSPRLLTYMFMTLLAGLRREPVKVKVSSPTRVHAAAPIQGQPAPDKRNG